MTLTPCPDGSAADWITGSAWPWDRVVTFGPEGFEAYARLRVVPDPAYDGQQEHEAEPTTDLTEIEQLGIAVALLSPHTRTPDDCYVAWWEGWPGTVAGFSPRDLESSRFDVPHRSFFLLRGSLGALGEWAAQAERASEDRPAFVWPADRAWCVAFDVDPHWAGIGATVAALDTLQGDPRLDVVVADPAERQPAYR